MGDRFSGAIGAKSLSRNRQVIDIEGGDGSFLMNIQRTGFVPHREYTGKVIISEQPSTSVWVVQMGRPFLQISISVTRFSARSEGTGERIYSGTYVENLCRLWWKCERVLHKKNGISPAAHSAGGGIAWMRTMLSSWSDGGIILRNVLPDDSRTRERTYFAISSSDRFVTASSRDKQWLRVAC